MIPFFKQLKFLLGKNNMELYAIKYKGITNLLSDLQLKQTLFSGDVILGM